MLALLDLLREDGETRVLAGHLLQVQLGDDLLLVRVLCLRLQHLVLFFQLSTHQVLLPRLLLLL